MKTTRPRGAHRAAPTFPSPLALLVVAALSPLVVAMAGCGGDDSVTGSGNGLQMLVGVTVSPNPVVAVPLAEGDSSGLEWSATYTVTLTESGGVGGTIVGLGVTLSAAADGLPIDTEDDPSSTVVADTDTRLEALSTKDLALTTQYSVPGEGSEAFIEVLFQIQDDDGFLIQGGQTFPVS